MEAPATTPPIKFAVVREDADLECVLVERTGAREALVVASGGCTALTLTARFPALRVTAFDTSPAQLAHVRDKLRAARRGDHEVLDHLNERGEFEGLFRVLRRFLEEFVFAEGEALRFFAAEAPEASARWRASRYWPAAFATAFNDPFLHAMFGPAATQHAPPGSYPGYFQRAFEAGLARADAPRNPFLQHVLLGRYRDEDRPVYQSLHRDPDLTLVEGALPDVGDLARFGVLSLSNVFDWSDDALVGVWAEALRSASPGAAVLIRQLNNTRDLRRFFGDRLRFDDALGAELLERDRSLFYNRVEVAFVR